MCELVVDLGLTSSCCLLSSLIISITGGLDFFSWLAIIPFGDYDDNFF